MSIANYNRGVHSGFVAALGAVAIEVAAEVFADLIILIAHESERQRIPTAEAVVQELKVLAGRVER